MRGATVAVIAPAGFPNLQDVDQGIELLKTWGFGVVEGKHLRSPQFRYFAGNSEMRSADLLWALSDPHVDIIWLARGGYGCVQCLDILPAAIPPGKTVVGYSDCTSLFSALHRYPDIRLIHGPMIEGLAKEVDEDTRESVRQCLQGKGGRTVQLTHLYGPTGPISGRLGGGNLTVLASISGTKWAMDGSGLIVLLEDITELGYRIDRSIMQLRLSGAFDGVAGIILGDFIRCALPNAAAFSLEEMLIDLLSPIGVPIASGFPMGHGPRNLAWIYGTDATLDQGVLRF